MNCAAPDCSSPVYAKEHCSRHYRQLLRHGHLLPARSTATTCAVEGCEGTRAARGWCQGHYLRWRRSGDVQADVPLGRSGRRCCRVPGCAREVANQDLCSPHWQRSLTDAGVRDDVPFRVTPGTGHVHHGYARVPVPADERWLVAGKTVELEHRLVLARVLGRPLRVDESVHHRNGDRLDNRPENLELWSRFQPNGQRVADKVAWAREVLRRWGHEHPEREEATVSDDDL